MMPAPVLDTQSNTHRLRWLLPDSATACLISGLMRRSIMGCRNAWHHRTFSLTTGFAKPFCPRSTHMHVSALPKGRCRKEKCHQGAAVIGAVDRL